MSNMYQNKAVDTSPIPAVPEEVLISLGQIAESAKEGLLALAVGAGMQVMYAMMDADVVALVGPKGKHVPERAAVRHGHEDGSVTLGGRRVAVRRPRVRAADGDGEVRLPSYEMFSSTEVLGRMANSQNRKDVPSGCEDDPADAPALSIQQLPDFLRGDTGPE